MQNLQLQISYRQILKIVLPISFAILVPQLNFLINTYFLGKLGIEELGVAGITGVYYLIFSAIGYGLNSGLQSLISRKAGENKPNEIGKLFNQAVLFAIAIAVVGIVLTYTILPIILVKILPNKALANVAIHFLQIRILGLPFLYMYQMRNALLVGTNQSKYLLYGTVADTGVNIALDYALIFGKFGMPQMGINGAAIASVIAEFVGMFVTYIIIKYKGLSKQFELFANIKIEKNVLQQIIKQSGPMMFQNAISIVSWFVFYLFIGNMLNAKLNLAISNVMRNVFGLFGVFIWALGSTTNTVISNIIGQGKQHEVPQTVAMLRNICMGFTLLTCTVLNIFPNLIISAFNNNAIFIANTIPVIRVITLAMVLMSVSIVYLNTIIAHGKSHIAFYIEVVAIILYLIYIYTTLRIYHQNLAVAWMSEWLYWTALLLLTYFYLKKIKVFT